MPIPSEEVVAWVSLVLRPVDQFTEREVAAELSVRLVGTKAPAIRTLSGLYAFEELEPLIHSMRVRAVGAHRGRYVDRTLEIDLSGQAGGTAAPLVRELELWPAPDYVFPPGTTLLRGRVETPAGIPVPEAEIGLDPPGPRSFSDARGDFVLWLDSVSSAQVVVVARKGANEVTKDLPVVAGTSGSAGVLELEIT